MSDHVPGRVLATVTCADRRGLVADVAGVFARRGCNILESGHFTDPQSRRFFMRVLAETGGVELGALRADFAALAFGTDLTASLHDPLARPKVLLLASKSLHCLNDLLFRWRHGDLFMEVAAVGSNHPDAAPLAEAFGAPFRHLPVTAQTRPEQEAAILALAEASGAELVVLARYMQVLSPELTRALSGRCINIHHSFLPSFKGAKPYHQAHARGVKLIGATAHFVTEDLDEGPIIAQDALHVDHAHSADDLVAVGRDVECQVLARAVKAWTERRVFLNGAKTVVLR
jgi:formyltetrahydrofolate deformylase